MSRQARFAEHQPEKLSERAIQMHTAGLPALSISLHPSSVTSTTRWRNLELRLMYHYTAVVCFTMPSCNGAPTEAWQQTIPQIAFSSEVVLNPMLALAALHFHAHSNDDRDMAVALHRYLGLALNHHRQALSNSGQGSSEHLWLSAVVLCHMCWLLAHQPLLGAAYELPTQAFNMLEGVGTLFVQNNVKGYGWIGHETLPFVVPDSQLSTTSREQLHNIALDLEFLLDEFDVRAMPEDDRNIYIEARDYVLYYYGAFYGGADMKTLQRFIAFMIVRCRPQYRDMLQRHDPLAMALLARMLVLLSELEFAWWAQGVGEYEVVERDIRGIIELMPSNLRWALDWPCRVLDKNISLNRC